MSRKAVGTLLVSISATAFGTYSLFALISVHAGFGPMSLLFYRFTIASFVIAVAGKGAGFLKLTLKELGPLVGLGLLYVGQSFTYLQCLRASNPITASLLLYLYPAFVTVGSVLFLQEKLTKVKVTALACAFAGSLLIIGPVGAIPGIAVAYGLGTATFYATYLLVGKRVLQNIPAMTATLVIITTAALVYGVGALSTGFDLPTSPAGWIGPIGLALVATVVAIGALLIGLERISPVEASSLSALEPLVGAVIAVLWLGTALKWWHVVGGALVILAVIVLARQSAKEPKAE